MVTECEWCGETISEPATNVFYCTVECRKKADAYGALHDAAYYDTLRELDDENRTTRPSG